MKLILMFALLLVSVVPANAQHTNQYCNSVYNFCLQIPGEFNRKGESNTGFGQYFTAKDGSLLTIFGNYNAYNETLKQRYDREIAGLSDSKQLANSTQLPTIIKTDLQENSYLIIYRQQQTNYLLFRTTSNPGWINLELTYPTDQETKYEQQAAEMIKSLR